LRVVTFAKAENKWEDEGGRRGEFLSALRQFTALLGRDWDPGAYPPIYASSPAPPPYMSSRAQLEDYERSHNFFLLFERLAAEDAERREDAGVY
jgi:hypothetical protein